jgi:phosphoribosyl-dephospho-CoA transferase
MQALQRNQLVWLHDAAWQRLLARDWDAQAQAILCHWQRHALPLVVCRQRPPEPLELPEPAEPAEQTHRISLGLPAPVQWQRRKLALAAIPQDIERMGHFPLLSSSALATSHAAQLQALLQHMQALQVPLRVYGSFGWQQLCGLPCVRDGSDLDLLAQVPDLATAGQVVWLLQGLTLPWRVDGELLFPNGWALAWREYAQLIGGRVEQVLVKHRHGAQLLGMAALRASLRGHRLQGALGAEPAQQV